MFGDENQEPVVLQSSWKQSRPTVEAAVQTKDVPVKDMSVQSRRVVEMETQTDETEEISTNLQLSTSDDKNLGPFLQRVYPEISKQLKANIKSRAFDGYDVNWDNEAEETTNPFTLKHSPIAGELEITSLSWNSRGSVIAASYGVHDHFGWCTHRSYLCTWNIDRRGIDLENADKALDLDSCLLCTAFHPELPSIIVGGNFNGDVVVWDLSREDDSVADSSAPEDNKHQEPVTKVIWVQDQEERRKKYKLCSVSGDGKMLLWDFNPITKKIYLASGFIVLTENIPRSMRSAKIRTDSALGVTSLSISTHDSNLFILGTESGCLFKCSFSSSRSSLKGMSSNVALPSPVNLAFDGHIGPVYDVSTSPFHRNLFLSCGSDSSAKIYSILQVHPLISIEPGLGYLFEAKWSPSRPSVLFLGSDSGKLICYDLKIDQNKPLYVFEVCQDHQAIYSLEFNPKRLHLIATGDGGGVIRIWSLSEELTTTSQGEETVLEGIASLALS